MSSLPELFENNISALDIPKNWQKRREDLLSQIVPLVFGSLPSEPEVFRFELLHSFDYSNPHPVRHNSYKIYIGPNDELQFSIDVHLPISIQHIEENSIPKLPLVINGDGCWNYCGEAVISEITKRGIAIALFNRCEIAKDTGREDRTSGVYRFGNKAFGAISAWAWAYQRCVDFAYQLPFIDLEKIAINGHSRGGKATLLAGATDTRIKVVSPNNSGFGGAGSFHVSDESCEQVNAALQYFPYWYAKDFSRFIDKDKQIPLDMHFLKAAVAPRYLLSTEALDDHWANPKGSWYTHQAAKEIYKVLGKEENICIHYRPGPHEHRLEDWVVFLDFLEVKLLGKTARYSIGNTFPM